MFDVEYMRFVSYPGDDVFWFVHILYYSFKTMSSMPVFLFIDSICETCLGLNISYVWIIFFIVNEPQFELCLQEKKLEVGDTRNSYSRWNDDNGNHETFVSFRCVKLLVFDSSTFTWRKIVMQTCTKSIKYILLRL